MVLLYWSFKNPFPFDTFQALTNNEILSLSTEDICQGSFIQLNTNLFFATKNFKRKLKANTRKKGWKCSTKNREALQIFTRISPTKKGFCVFCFSSIIFCFCTCLNPVCLITFFLFLFFRLVR